MQQFIEKLSQFAVSSKFIGSIIILALTFLVTKLVSKLFKMMIKKGRVNVTHLTFLRRIVISVLWVLGVSGVLLQFEPFQKFVMSFLASSGILAVILGFAAQEAVGNLVSGMFISLFKPFELGDRIRIPSENIEGFVEDISLRHTVIRTFENSRIIVPNSIMNKAVLENVNFSESKYAISWTLASAMTRIWIWRSPLSRTKFKNIRIFWITEVKRKKRKGLNR